MYLSEINPYVRYVNHYCPVYDYAGRDRLIYDYEFFYVLDGKAIIGYNGTEYHLKKGDLFYIKPGVANYHTVKGRWGLKTHCIHFDWTVPEQKFNFTAEEMYLHSALVEDYEARQAYLLKRPVTEPVDMELPILMQGLPYERFSGLFRNCYRAYQDNTPFGQLKRRADFMQLIAALAQAMSEQGMAETVHPQMIRAAEYIKAHYQEHITVLQLAKRYSLSPKYFGRLFREGIGKSVNAFLLEQRLFAAKEMLLGTDRSMEQIADDSGFRDPFYFSKCFKQSEGISPSQYRKRQDRT